MKIAFASFYNGLIERGAETWTLQLSSRLQKLGHNVTIIQSGPNESSLVPTISIPTVSIFAFAVKTVPVLWRENYDVVVPINGRWLALFTRVLTWLKDEKLVIVGHSGKGRDDAINAWCFPNRFVALSTDAMNWVKSVNPFIKVTHIQVGVDTTKFTPSGDKAKLFLRLPVVLAVAALEEHKQLDLTIRAVALLDKVNLLILGKGPKEGGLTRLADELMPGRCLIMHAPFDQMPEYYRAASVFTLGSWTRESYPAVYLEAMACNLPAVGTDDPARNEIIGKAGILVNPEDSRAYAAALESAINKDWANLPRVQAEKFSWDKKALEYEKMFASL